MQTCANCGNTAQDMFSITRDEMTRHFDSFECAVHMMAPRCAHCQCAILGHPVRKEGGAFCCSHCAEGSESSQVPTQ